MSRRKQTTVSEIGASRKERPRDCNGNPTGHVFSLALVEQLCSHLRDGLFVENASALCGVSARAVQTWLAKGRADMENAERVHARTGVWELSDYGKAMLMIEAAKAQIEGELVREVVRLGTSAESEQARFAAAAWYLERAKPKVYGSKAMRVDLPPSAIDMSDEDVIDEVMRRIERVEAATAPKA